MHFSSTAVSMAASGLFASAAIAQAPPEFTQVQEIATNATWGVALGDLDGDGDLDVMFANPYEPNTVWMNDGTGTLTDSGQALGGTDFHASIALGDLDGDGDLDAVIGTMGWSTVWINDGTGTFADSGQLVGGGPTIEVALGDVDGDGDLDAFFANGGQADNLWINDGTGTFADSGQVFEGKEYIPSYGVALGDVDGDGDLDAMVSAYLNAVPDQPDPQNFLYINDGTGTFTDSGQALGDSDSGAVALGDIDGDGDLDAVFSNRAVAGGLPNTVWMNDGTGTFTDSGQALGNDQSIDLALGDLDGDGDLDVVFANRVLDGAAPSHDIWINDGAGTFASTGQALDPIGAAWTPVLGDLDGDDDLDIVVSHTPSAKGGVAANVVWLNGVTGDDCVPGDVNGDGVYDETDVRLGMAEFGIIEASDCPADINGDGLVDGADVGLLVASWGLCP